MKKIRFSALLFVLCMTTSLFPAPALAAEEASPLVPAIRDYPGFTDVNGSWCEDYIKTVYEAGLMEGYGVDVFDCGGHVTIAQITVITARIHSLLNGGTGVLPAPEKDEAWYQPAIDYLKAHVADANGIGPILGTRIVQMETVPYYAQLSAPRWDLVSFLTAVLPEDALAPINKVTSLPDTEDEEALRFYSAGILTGSDQYGTFLGHHPLTRGQTAAILARVIDPSLRLRFDQLDLFQDVIGDTPKEMECTLVYSTGTEGADALLGMSYKAGEKEFDRILEELKALPFRSTLTAPSQVPISICTQEDLLDAYWQTKGSDDGQTCSFVISFKNGTSNHWLGYGYLAHINGIWTCTDFEHGITCVLDLPQPEESGLAFEKTLEHILLDF